MQCGARYCHEAYRTNANYSYGLTKLDFCELDTVESRGDHVAQHDRCGGVYRIRKKSEVCICFVYMEVFTEYAVFEVRELPTCEHSTGVNGEAVLSFEGTPVRSDCWNDDSVAGLKRRNEASYLYDFTDSLVAKYHVVTVSYCAFPNRVDIGCTGGYRYWFYYCVKRTAFGHPLFDPTCASQS